jgi:hypothetical protein
MNDEWHWDDPPRGEWLHKTALAVLVVFVVGGGLFWWLFFREVWRWMR